MNVHFNANGYRYTDGNIVEIESILSELLCSIKFICNTGLGMK